MTEPNFRNRTLFHGDNLNFPQAIGERGLVDLVGTIGYYGLVSATLNVFEVPLPPGEDAPFPEDG